jgi:NAD(P)-dependent dehydrogenase (short-subunit alcohol dehydrogenase family)
MTKPVALVTGAGSGIGRAIARALAGAGCRVALVGRREGRLCETAALMGVLKDESLVIPADLGEAGEARRIVRETVAHWGRLDVLVNNAGAAPSLPIEAHTAEVLEDVYAINALAPANAIAEAWPVFVRQRGACIVSISTLGTLDPFPGFFGYAAAKAALNVMTMSCAKEGAASGIRAFCIAPGAVETEMFRALVPESEWPRSKTLAPEDVAAAVLDCVQNRRRSENGKTIVLAGSPTA